MPDLFLRGLAIGFAVAVALGPIGLLVIRRTIERGWGFGLVSGLGVATADAMYAAIAAYGLTVVTSALVGIDRPLGIIGGGVLVVLAVRSLRSALQDAGREPSRGDSGRRGFGRRGGSLAAWTTMVALTLTNPATILSFAALFAGIGAATGGATGATALVLGVFAGSAAWWVLLTGSVARLRTRLSPRVVRALNIVSAAVIGVFGLVAMALGIAG